jgi:hypothetical protein
LPYNDIKIWQLITSRERTSSDTGRRPDDGPAGTSGPTRRRTCFVDDGRILRLRIEARSALCLRIGDSHRSNNKDRGSQSHGDFTHQILLLNGGVFWGT